MLTNIQMVKTDEFGANLGDREIIQASKIDIDRVTLKISKVADISDSEQRRLFEIFNKFKFVILECEPLPNLQDNLLALKQFLVRSRNINFLLQMVLIRLKI